MGFKQCSGFFEMEDGTMRRTVLSAAAAFAILAGAALVPQSAEAMTLPAPAGIAAAVQENTLAQDVAYVCGGRRSCYWTAPRYYRPYYRRHHWRRW